jgi:hypothetical protein
MIVPPNVNLSTMTAQSRGSVNVLVHPLKDSLTPNDAMRSLNQQMSANGGDWINRARFP